MTATLGRDSDYHDDETRAKVVERTPLPKFQIFIVFLIQFAEPVTATVIYPFINDLVRETGVTGGDEAKTGYYAGIIESIFFISETLTVFGWGVASDLVGRKPILLLGPLGLSLSMLGFGLSKTFWALVFYRMLQGFFNGNIGVSKSVIAEITDKTNISDAYALLPLMWHTGVTIGPILGGLLTRPSERWPGTFGKIALLKDYPYFLPCAIAASFAFLSFVISSIALRETHHTDLAKRIKRWFKTSEKSADDRQPLLSSGNLEYGTTVDHTGSVRDPAPKPQLSELFTPDMLSVLKNYGMLSFLDMANSALVPLVFSTPIEYGGLGLSPYQIGMINGAYGFSCGVLQAAFLGMAVRHFGPKRLYSMCLVTLMVPFLAFPLANFFARQAGYADWKVGCVIFVQFASMAFIGPCYTAMQVMVVHTAPSPGLMGSANGVAQMIASGARSLAPAAASSLFAMSIAHHLLGGYMVYAICWSLVLVGIWLSRGLPSTNPS